MPAPASEEHQAWRDRNPLRAWRHKNDETMATVAGRMNVAFVSVQLWESGGRVPTDIAVAKMAELMDRDPAGLRRSWSRWLDQRPSVAA